MRQIKFENKIYPCKDITYDRAKMCWEDMKRKWETGSCNVPHLHRSCVRSFYHAVSEDGLVKSGLSSIPLPYGLGITIWKEINDIEDDHFTAPEATARYMYAKGEDFFLEENQFENKFLGWFLWSKETHFVSGEFNQKLRNTSGRMHNNSNKFKNFPECTTADKYPDAGVKVMYDINNDNKEVEVSIACPAPFELTEYQKQFIPEKPKNLWEIA